MRAKSVETRVRAASSIVMPGLVPGIHVSQPVALQAVDGRVKPGHGAEKRLYRERAASAAP
jgi:hypothetical protein